MQAFFIIVTMVFWFAFLLGLCEIPAEMISGELGIGYGIAILAFMLFCAYIKITRFRVLKINKDDAEKDN